MARITVNPEVESASGGFPVWAVGRYTLRITEVRQETTKTGKPMLVIVEEPVSDVLDEDGNTLTNAGKLFDRVLVDPVATKNGGTVSFLRPLIEAAGLTWSDFDTEDLVGKELNVQVGIEEYNGTRRNAVTRYLKG